MNYMSVIAVTVTKKYLEEGYRKGGGFQKLTFAQVMTGRFAPRGVFNPVLVNQALYDMYQKDKKATIPQDIAAAIVYNNEISIGFEHYRNLIETMLNHMDNERKGIAPYTLPNAELLLKISRKIDTTPQLQEQIKQDPEQQSWMALTADYAEKEFGIRILGKEKQAPVKKTADTVASIENRSENAAVTERAGDASEAKSIDDIITRRLSPDEIDRMLSRGKISKEEAVVLHCAAHETSFFMQALGTSLIKFTREEDRLQEKRVFLNTMYGMNLKFPEYHFADLFNYMIQKLTDLISGNIEHLLQYVYLQLQNEKYGIATFQLRDLKALEAAKEKLKEQDFKAFLTKQGFVERTGNPEGLWGVFREYNKTFISEADFSIFDSE